MENEEIGELEITAKEGNDVNTTIHTKGWVNVIRPALIAKQQALIHEFAGAKTYEDFVTIQQGLNALQGVLDFIEVKLIEGKVALDELRKSN